MPLDPDYRALLERAVADPTTITPAEKNLILDLPPPDEEQRLLQSTLGVASREALVDKALALDNDNEVDNDKPANLTYDEARWLQQLGVGSPFSPNSDEAFAKFQQLMRRPAEDRVRFRRGCGGAAWRRQRWWLLRCRMAAVPGIFPGHVCEHHERLEGG